MASDPSTTTGLRDGPAGPVGRWTTRACLIALVLLLVAGVFGFLGLRTDSREATGGGYRLEVDYPKISRAGQPAPFHVRVERSGGFPADTVQVSLCDHLFDVFDFQNWYPNPSSETASGSEVVYEFDSPPGDVLEVSLDARVGPGRLGGRDRCEVAVLEDDEPVVSLSFTAWRVP